MTNNQYTENILSKVDYILLDTSSLMCHGCQQFISNIRDELIETGKKIVIPQSVYSELARHLGSADPEKSEAAQKAVEVLCSNRDIFQIESTVLTEEEIAHAFADAQLLSELTLHKGTNNQLLITNDKKLSCDAFDLNQQQSCKGGKVLVCYINWYGEMHCCDCAKNTVQKHVDNIEKESNFTEFITSVENKEKNKIEKTNEWSFDWKSGAITIFSGALFYGLCKGGSIIIKNMK